MRATTEAAGAAGRWGMALLDLIFPSRCIGCRRAGTALCPSCLSSIVLIRPPFCALCGSPTLHCDLCTNYPRHFDCARSATLHEGITRDAIHALKYKGRVDLGRPLGVLLKRYLDLDPLEFDVITAVPLAPLRRRERGYNQSELLARALSKETGRPYAQGLYRVRETTDQIGKNPAERHANVHEAFKADAGAFRGKRVLLIDDVCTTGATLDACAVAMRAEGVQRVYGLTVARPRERVS